MLINAQLEKRGDLEGSDAKYFIRNLLLI